MRTGLEPHRTALLATLEEGEEVTRCSVLGPPEPLREQSEAARRFADAQHAPATRTAYSSDFRAFERWCRGHGVGALPALAIATLVRSMS